MMSCPFQPNVAEVFHRAYTALDMSDSVLLKTDLLKKGKTSGKWFLERQKRHKELHDRKQQALDNQVYKELVFKPQIYENTKKSLTPRL